MQDKLRQHIYRLMREGRLFSESLEEKKVGFLVDTTCHSNICLTHHHWRNQAALDLISRLGGTRHVKPRNKGRLTKTTEAFTPDVNTKLPQVCWQHILAYLHANDLAKKRRVSKGFYAACQIHHHRIEYAAMRSRQPKTRKVLDHHPHITDIDRRALVNDMIAVQRSLGLCEKTFFLAVIMLDHHLGATRNIERHQLRFLGVTCIKAASGIIVGKSHTPSTARCAMVLGNMYSKQEIEWMEEVLVSSSAWTEISTFVDFLDILRSACGWNWSKTKMARVGYALKTAVMEYDIVSQLDVDQIVCLAFAIGDSTGVSNVENKICKISESASPSQDALDDLKKACSRIYVLPNGKRLDECQKQFSTIEFYRVAKEFV